MNRHLVAVGVAAAVVLPAGLAAAAPATTVGPDVVAWWSATNRDARVPSVSPPDVGPDDLYVAGASPAGLDALGPTGPVALAGLRFRLPAGSAATTLRLTLHGVTPPAVSLTACRALQPFDAAHGGPWADVPTYDCTRPGTARLGTDGTVVVDGVDALRDGRDLDLVLVPGPLDRVVLAAPDDRALSVTAPVTGPPPAPGPSLPPGTGPAPAPAPAAPPAAAVAPLVTAPLATGRPPATASPVAPPALAGPATRTAAGLPDRPWPALLATLLIALGAFVPLVRPTLRGAPETGTERGVGRFRSERSGSVPDLV